MDLDDVVPAQIESLESLQVPEDRLRNRGQAVAGQIQDLEGATKWVQVLPFQLGDEVVWKSRMSFKTSGFYSWIQFPKSMAIRTIYINLKLVFRGLYYNRGTIIATIIIQIS